MPPCCTPTLLSLPHCRHRSTGVRWRPRRQRGGLHHLPRLSSGVPASPELSLDHHGAGALAAHRPQLQPTLWDREAGLQVRRGGGAKWEAFYRCHTSGIYKSLFSLSVKLLWPITLHDGALLFGLNDDLHWHFHQYAAQAFVSQISNFLLRHTVFFLHTFIIHCRRFGVIPSCWDIFHILTTKGQAQRKILIVDSSFLQTIKWTVVFFLWKNYLRKRRAHKHVLSHSHHYTHCILDAAQTFSFCLWKDFSAANTSLN